MGSIRVNGKTYQGNNVSMINGKVFVDGKEVDSGDSDQKVVIHCDGNLTFQEFQCSNSVEINGNVTGNISCHGSFTGHNITGDVNAGGSVNCDNIGGSVKAGGSVNCDDIGGNVTAGGSINRS